MVTKRNPKLIFAGKRVNIEISDINYAQLDSDWNLKNVRSSFTRIYFPIDGEGNLTVGDEQIKLCPDNIYIIPSGLCFSGFCPERMNKIFVHLTLTAPDGSDIFYGMDRCIVVKDKKELTKKAVELYHESSIMSALEFKLLLYELLVGVLNNDPALKEELKSYSDVTISVIDYISEHLSASLTIDEISGAIFLPKGRLQRKFKEDIGRLVGHYIDDCLSQKAEEELLDPSLSISEISERLGFCDQFYFSRKFKKTHGISPRVFRQKHGI